MLPGSLIKELICHYLIEGESGRIGEEENGRKKSLPYSPLPLISLSPNIPL
jgi:hypothetical protein